MTERKEDIRRLLDRYMAGDTTLEEEARLADYFRSPGADKEFAAFRDMFSLFDQGKPSFSEQEMDEWIEDVQSPKSDTRPAGNTDRDAHASEVAHRHGLH